MEAWKVACRWGDELNSIFLKKSDENWSLSDESNVFFSPLPSTKQCSKRKQKNKKKTKRNEAV